MNEISVTKTDETVMKLLHYFITEQNYNPIVLQGAKNEIWLENLEQDYQIVRIVTDYIHNDEQFEFDLFKTRKISKRIKKKMFSWKMNVLCFYLNIGENVSNETSFHVGNITYVQLKEIEELKKQNLITTSFPTLLDHTHFTEDGLELFMKLTTDINQKNEHDALEAEDVFRKKKPVVTYFLLWINLLMFLLMYIFGSGSHHVGTLLKFGADYKPLVQMGEVWRLISSAFLHIGILHLLCNMYALYVIGPQLESFFGKTKFLVIYLFSALCGNLFSDVFSVHIGAGASGAIFGLLGALLYFGYHYRVYLGSVMKSQIIPIILLNLMIGFTISGIDNAAHIGGLIAGVFSAMAMGVKYKTTKFEQLNGYIISTIFVAFLIYMGFMI